METDHRTERCIHLDRWGDPSGERLRDWMGVSREMFYDERRIAVAELL